MSRNERLARAFLQQARADFDTYIHLEQQAGEIPACHRLQFLQMACEKVCKSYLFSLGADPDSLMTSHAYIATTLPSIARELVRRREGRPHSDRKPFIRQVGHLARQIELLAPAADDGGRRRDNCEYPWEDDADGVFVPSEYTFPNLHILRGPVGVALIRDLLPRAFTLMA